MKCPKCIDAKSIVKIFIYFSIEERKTFWKYHVENHQRTVDHVFVYVNVSAGVIEWQHVVLFCLEFQNVKFLQKKKWIVNAVHVRLYGVAPQQAKRCGIHLYIYQGHRLNFWIFFIAHNTTGRSSLNTIFAVYFFLAPPKLLVNKRIHVCTTLSPLRCKFFFSFVRSKQNTSKWSRRRHCFKAKYRSCVCVSICVCTSGIRNGFCPTVDSHQ